MLTSLTQSGKITLTENALVKYCKFQKAELKVITHLLIYSNFSEVFFLTKNIYKFFY